MYGTNSNNSSNLSLNGTRIAILCLSVTVVDSAFSVLIMTLCVFVTGCSVSLCSFTIRMSARENVTVRPTRTILVRFLFTRVRIHADICGSSGNDFARLRLFCRHQDKISKGLSELKKKKRYPIFITDKIAFISLTNRMGIPQYI